MRRPLAGKRSDCKAREESGAKATVGKTPTTADGGYPGTGLVRPRHRRKGEDLPDWKQEHNKSHRQVRARVGRVIARMKTWKILRWQPNDQVKWGPIGVYDTAPPVPGPSTGGGNKRLIIAADKPSM